MLGVVVDDGFYFGAGERTRKARNLVTEPRCTVSGHGEGFDLVLEGTAEPVSDPATVTAVAQAYGDKYGWHPEVREGALWADGAPTAGPPPYRVFRVRPATAFALPTDDAPVPTRWRF